MVIPIGLEPITSRLGILRSILMSYGTTGAIITRVVDLTRERRWVPMNLFGEGNHPVEGCRTLCFSRSQD